MANNIGGRNRPWVLRTLIYKDREDSFERRFSISFLSLHHQNNRSEKFNLIAKKLFLDRKNTEGAFAPLAPSPPTYAYGCIGLESNAVGK